MKPAFITASWKVTEADLLAAHRWVEGTRTSNGTPFMGNHQTIEDDNGLHIIDGALGEVLFQRNVCPTAVKLEGTQIGSDFAIGNTGIRVDVKTKRRKGPLQPYYVAEVDLAQQHHATDWYAFMSLDTINWVMEYIACISKKHFWELGWPMEAGTELVAPGGQLHPVKKTCYHLDAQTIYQNAQFLPNHFIQQKPKPKTTTMAQENKPKSFIMFPNDYATKDSHPQWKGKIVLEDGSEEQIVAWEKTSAKGVRFLSGKFEPFRAQQSDNQAAQQGSTAQGSQSTNEQSPF